MTSIKKKAISENDVLAVMEKYNGNVAAIARHYGVSRGTVYNRINESIELAEALKDSRESIIDDAEAELYKQIKDGNTTALIFFLKTQGKGRGYIERQEHRIETWHDDVIEDLRNGRMTEEDVYDLWPQLASGFIAKAGLSG
jgi:hypothetical protein